MKISQHLQRLCFGVMMIPLNQANLWQPLEFNSLPANTVIFAKEGMTVDVNKSSSPLIFPFKKPVKIKSVTLKGTLLKGQLKIPVAKKQGEKGVDDFLVKLGLVKKGKKTLNWAQRQIAPKWITTLYSLAPKGAGVEHIQFMALGSQKKIEGRKRTHPLSDLITEHVVGTFEPGKPIVLAQVFKTPVDTLALWLSLDGDDTQSSFSVKIHEIKIETE